MSRSVIGYVTCGSRVEARKLARALLNAKLVACVNIVGQVESHYRWQGKLEQARECLLMIKTTESKSGAVTQLVKSLHRYEVPEIIFTRIASGERRYLKWIASSVAALVLTATGWADGFDLLVKQLGSTNDEQRVEAVEKIARVGGPRAERLFRDMVSSGSSERRQMAAIGLLQVSDADEDAERVHGLLRDADSIVRWSAAVALGQTGRREAVAWLETAAAAEKNDEVRETITDAARRLEAGIFWERALPKRSTKPVLVYFFVRGPGVCQQYEEGALADKDVVAATRELVCVRLEADKHAEEARRWEVHGAPMIVLFDANGGELARASGVVTKEKLLRRLSLRSAAPAADDVEANWQLAEIHLDEGREELATPYLHRVIEADEADQHGHTGPAIFALGFSFGKAGKHAQAAYCLQKLLERWPKYKDRDKALYCLALSQLATGQKVAGRATLEMLVAEYGGTALGQAGKRVLEKLENK